MGACGSKSGQNVDAPDEIEINPDTLRAEIDELFKDYLDKKDQLKPFVLEKMGLEVMLEEKRKTLAEVMTRSEALRAEREPLLAQCWQKDAADIYNAFNKAGQDGYDKAQLTFVIVNRTKWQLKAIADVFFSKYKKKLLEFIVQEMQTTAGKLFTGKNTGLGNLFMYRIMDQPERDAALLRDATGGILKFASNKDVIEIICTRTNAELHAAIEKYKELFGENLLEVIRKKAGYENFREFLLKVCECNRDEDNRPFDGETASKLAAELQAAAAAKNPEPFIRIIAPINHIQFESINSKYKDNKLLSDFNNKFSGDFRDAVSTRVQSKYDFYASILDRALGGLTGVDDQSLCRILGSLSRIECVKLSDSYNRLFPAKTLEAKLKGSSLANTTSFLTACLNLLCPSDTTLMPLGSDREQGEDEEECVRDGERTKIAANINYKPKDAREKGEKVASTRRPVGSVVSEEEIGLREDLGDDYERSKAAFKPTAFESASSGRGGRDDDEGDDEGDDARGAHTREEDGEDVDEYGIPKYHWDPLRGRFLDIDKLTEELMKAREVHNTVADKLLTASEEALGMKDMYLQTVKLVVTTENWIRIYSAHLKALKVFHTAREAKDKAAAPGKGKVTPKK